jgi:putative ABC transport system substrate-binding protein
MKRREFITLIGCAAATWPLAARAQQTEKIPVVGFFYPGPKVAAPTRITAFLAGLRSGGFSEPANVTLIPQITNGDPALLSPMAADLVARKVDLIFAVSSVALQAARDATTTIPIVSIDLETDPIGSGLVKSIAQPGGNITGVFLDFPDFAKKWLEVLKETIPQVSTIAVLWDPTTTKTQLTAIQAAAGILNLKLEVLEVRSRADLEAAFPSASRRAAGAVLMLSSPLIGANTNLLAELALTQKLPAITLFSDFARNGGLMAYGPNLLAQYRLAGVMAAKILHGTKPAVLPIESPTRFEFILNLKTAGQFGLTVPPLVLLRADEVIE